MGKKIKFGKGKGSKEKREWKLGRERSKNLLKINSIRECGWRRKNEKEGKKWGGKRERVKDKELKGTYDAPSSFIAESS